MHPDIFLGKFSGCFQQRLNPKFTGGITENLIVLENVLRHLVLQRRKTPGVPSTSKPTQISGNKRKEEWMNLYGCTGKILFFSLLSNINQFIQASFYKIMTRLHHFSHLNNSTKDLNVQLKPQCIEKCFFFSVRH